MDDMYIKIALGHIDIITLVLDSRWNLLESTFFYKLPDHPHRWTWIC